MSTPATPPNFARFAELATDLYAIHPVGGPLHVVLDDGNTDGTITPYYGCYDPAELDEPYHQGWRLADLHPAAPAVVEHLGSSMRQLCDGIAALMNGWTVEQRDAAIARWREGRRSR